MNTLQVFQLKQIQKDMDELNIQFDYSQISSEEYLQRMSDLTEEMAEALDETIQQYQYMAVNYN